MHPMVERCAGLDVHQATVMATVRIPDGHGGRQGVTETFGTTRGHKKAVVATGHQILEIAYFVMHDGVTYQERGPDYFDRRHRDRAIRRHVRQLEALGYKVTLNDEAA